MLWNKKGYFLLYFLSFCISTGIFHAVAHAQESALASEHVRLVEPVRSVPGPTVHIDTPVTIQPPNTVQPSVTPSSQDNPAVLAAKTEAPQITPTEVPPTATPTRTPIQSEQAEAPSPTIVQTATPTENTSVISEEALTYLGNCETGMTPTKNTGNGYYGAFQFSEGTWKSLSTGYERADFAPLDVQKAAVKQLLQRSSIYTQFPGCASKMKTAGLI